MQFRFPPNIEEFQRITGMGVFTQRLREENSLMGSNVSYRCSLRKSIYLYVTCKYKKCPARLCYRKSQEVFELVRYNNIHNHGQNCQRNSQYSKIEVELNDLPLTVSMAAAKHYICTKYHITPRCYYYLHQKVRNKKMTYLQLSSHLDSQKYQIQSDPYYYEMNQLPDLMIAVSPQMKNNFRKFGDWVGFDFTFNLVQDIKRDKQPYRIGVFVGLSSAKKIVPFGFVICNEENAQRYYSIFKTFGQIMGRMPNIIITDEDKSAISALKTLKEEREFNGFHLLDTFHIMRNVKKRLDNKACFTFFNRLIKERSKLHFEVIVNEALEALESEQDVKLLRKFVENGTSYCFSQIPNYLYGFLPSTAINQKIHDLIKTMLPFSKPFTVVVKKILLYLEELGVKSQIYQIEQNKMEKIFSYPHLKEIRFSVCKSIFKDVIQELSKGIHLYLQFSSPSLAIVEQNGIQYQLRKLEEIWTCNCTYLQKTGVFCCHIAKLVLSNKDKLIDYIHPRWKISSNQQQEIKKQQRFPSKTRRNRK